jgi:hypothetical protein
MDEGSELVRQRTLVKQTSCHCGPNQISTDVTRGRAENSRLTPWTKASPHDFTISVERHAAEPRRAGEHRASVQLCADEVDVVSMKGQAPARPAVRDTEISRTARGRPKR